MIGEFREISNLDFNKNNIKFQDANKMVNNTAIQQEVENKTVAGVQKKDINKINECETCANRRYQDDSSDSGVSFQAPTRLTPQQASSAVVSHEKEHFTREASRAKSENKDVLVNSIRIHSAICPDCGKAYISGGETTTVTKTRKNDSPSPIKEAQSDGHFLDIGM